MSKSKVVDKCREAFEELSNIRTFLPSFKFEEEANEYVRSERFTQPDYTFGFFNGAWYSWQSRQGEIDEKDKRIEEALKLIKRWSDQSYRDDAEQLIVDIEEALRGNSDINLNR